MAPKDVTSEVHVQFTLDELIDRAKVRSKITSDRELDQRLGLKGQVTRWRNGYGFPSPGIMCRLSNLADVDPAIGKAHLDLWLAEKEFERESCGTTSIAATTAAEILNRLISWEAVRRTLPVILALPLFTLLMVQKPAETLANSATTTGSRNHHTMYIMYHN